LGIGHGLAFHHLAPGPVEVAERMVALHSTDPSSVYLSALVRMRDPGIGRVEDALYETRELVRMLGMRRTMFVVPRDLAPVVQASSTDAVAAMLGRQRRQMLSEAGITQDPGTWLREVTASVVAILAERGEATGAEIAAAEPRLQSKITLAEGKRYASTGNVTSLILSQIAAEGHIVRGRPMGSWISSQYRWSTAESWLPGAAAAWTEEAAQAELARRWLRSFGPATVADLRWWTGWTARDTNRALAGLAAVEVDLDGTPGLVLEEEAAPVAAPAPWVALLPALDPTPMGWTGRDWFLGPHAAALFDRSGNIGPTVWSDGRIVGGWAQTKDGSIAFRLLEEVGGETRRSIEAAAEALAGLLGKARVTPRFRIPLERELTAG
jgi:hypothetical protein